MGQAQINVRTWACSRTSIARTKQAALTHNVRGKELKHCVAKKCHRHNLLLSFSSIFTLIDFYVNCLQYRTCVFVSAERR